jgi:hypothetical protein
MVCAYADLRSSDSSRVAVSVDCVSAYPLFDFLRARHDTFFPSELQRYNETWLPDP